MKKMIVSCLFIVQAFALSPPKPIEGSPSIVVGKEFSTGAGDYLFTFHFPTNWGLGDVLASRDGSGYFELFPGKGGVGCSIQVENLGSDDAAQARMAELRATFSSTKSISDGFEADLSKAWYACRVFGSEVAQFWYSLPKKKKEHNKIWDEIKNCISISYSAPRYTMPPVKTDLPPVMEHWKGWQFNRHNQHVLFKTNGPVICTPNIDTSRAHALDFNDSNSKVIFYLKWDQKEDKDAFAAHFDEMLADVKKVAPNQKMIGAPRYELQAGYAVWQGDPYTFITLSGDGAGFLFAFAVQAIFNDVNVDDLVNRVEWWSE